MRIKATFTDMLPIIEIDNGLAFLTVNEEGHSVCTTIHNFEVFLEAGRRAVVAWHAKQAPVVPFRRPGEEPII